MRSRGEDARAARSYFAGRGFGSDVCRRWNLGYAPGRGALVGHLREKGFSAQEMYACDLAVERNGRPSDRFFERVMFPIHDERGCTIAFGGRVLAKDKPVNTGKYVNTRDTVTFNKRKHLFAYDRAKETMRSAIVYQTSPSATVLIIAAVSAVVSLILGLAVFRKTEHKFILYI